MSSMWMHAVKMMVEWKKIKVKWIELNSQSTSTKHELCVFICSMLTTHKISSIIEACHAMETKTCLNYNVISSFYSLTEFLYPLSLCSCSFSFGALSLYLLFVFMKSSLFFLLLSRQRARWAHSTMRHNTEQAHTHIPHRQDEKTDAAVFFFFSLLFATYYWCTLMPNSFTPLRSIHGTRL